MSGWSLSDGRCCRGEDKRKQQVMRMHWQAFWHYKDFAHEQLLWLPEVIMNIAVFIPVGFALGLAFRKAKGWQAVMAGMGISVGIELLQWLFRKGFADVDDVIHNVLGCALGYIVYWFLRRRKRLRGESN